MGSSWCVGRATGKAGLLPVFRKGVVLALSGFLAVSACGPHGRLSGGEGDGSRSAGSVQAAAVPGSVDTGGEKDLEARADTLEEGMPPSPSMDGCRVMTVSVVGRVALAVRDSLGRCVGYDPLSGEYLSTMPGALRTPIPIGDMIGIGDAIDGTYWIEVIGVSDGEFGISMAANDCMGQLDAWDSSASLRAGASVKYRAIVSFRPTVSVEVHAVAPDSLQQR